MKLYFAGAESKDFQSLLHANGVKRVLVSYYYLQRAKQDNVKTDTMHAFPDMILDSGGFTARKMGRPIDVVKYARFINQNDVRLAVNLDTNDVDESLRNATYLRMECPRTRILDVYHMDEFYNVDQRELIKRYSESGYFCYAGAGWQNVKRDERKRVNDYVFNITRDQCRVHGLAVTAPEWMKQYPWYSVDSSTWLVGGKFGVTMTFNERTGRVYRQLMDKTRTKSKSYIDVIPAIESYSDRNASCIRSFLQLENYASRMWKRRGVQWKQLQLNTTA